MLILIIAGGPDKGRIYELNNDAPIVLGREGDQVKLNDRKVSREHARLWCEGGQWYLEDLGSRHGTYRNHAELEKDQKAKLKDGDYIQIGDTVMVLGRMPAEHAERLALLARQSEPQPSTLRRPMLIVGGASIAALLGLGAYIAVQLNALRSDSVPREEFAQLNDQFMQAQKQLVDRIDQTNDSRSADTRKLLTQNQQLETSLAETTAAISRHGSAVTKAADAFESASGPILTRLDDVNEIATRQQLAIERLGEMLAHQQTNDTGPQVLAMVQQMKTLLADQPKGDVLMARLEEAIQTNAQAAGEAVKLALAGYEQSKPENATASATETEALLNRMLAELAKVPTRAQIAEEIRLAVAESRMQDEQFMRLLLAELRRTGDQISTSVVAALDEDAGTALQIASDLQAKDNESAARTAAMIESLLDKVDDQQALTEQITLLRDQIQSLPGRDDAAVRAVISRLEQQDRNNTAMLKSIADLRAMLPSDLPDRLDQVLAQLDKQVRTDQITDAIEKSIERIASARDEQTLAALAEFSKRIDALPDAKQLAELTSSQQALADLLDKSDAREAIGELRTALEELETRLPESGDEKLAQVIDMLKQREKADLLLAELHDAMANQSQQTDALKTELLEAVASASDEKSGQTLQELLALVRDRLATDESVRQAIRDEVRGTLLPNQMSLTDARDVTTSSNPGTEHATTQNTDKTDTQRLTRLELAYKQSFETGQPVTVGAGTVDPDTGQVSEGRRIDPAVAKALGFETWRDWYLTDRHAEQMRLQQEAIRQRNQNEAKDNGTVELPPVEPVTQNDRPEQE